MAGKHRLANSGQAPRGSAGYARYVGRVGALAVALGIGSAVGGGIGVANADDAGPKSTVDHDRTEQRGSSAGSVNRVGDALRRRALTSPGPRRAAADQDGQADPETSPRVRIKRASPEEVGQRLQDAVETAVEDAVGRAQAKLSNIGAAVERTRLIAKDSRAAAAAVIAAPDATDTAAPGTDLSGDVRPAPRPSLPAALSERVRDVIDKAIVHPASTPATATAVPQRAALAIPAVRALDSLITSTSVVADSVAITTATPQTFLSRLDSAVNLSGATAPIAPASPIETLTAFLDWVRRQFESAFDNRTPTITPTLSTPVVRTVVGQLNPEDIDLEPDRLGELAYTASGLDPGASVVFDRAAGTFTYTAGPGYGAVNDEFTITVSDADSGWHLHGLLGLFTAGNLHSSTATVTVQIEANSPPVVDATEPYTLDPAGPDPLTGAVKGKVNVTDDHPDTLRYHVATAPNPGLGTLDLDEITGEWTFTPTPGARLAATVNPKLFTFAIVATDGSYSTAPITISENVAGATKAALTLPPGASPYQGSTTDPATGNTYQLSYNATTNRTYVTVIHADGTYATSAPDPIPGTPLRPPVVVGETTYVFTANGGGAEGFHTYITVVGADGSYTAPDAEADALPGLSAGPVDIGGSTYAVMYDRATDKTYFTKLAADGSYAQPDLDTEGIIGFPLDRVTVGGTTYQVTKSNADDVYITALGPDATHTPPDVIPGVNYLNIVAIGDKAYLSTVDLTWSTSYVTVIDADGYTVPDAVDDAIPGYPANPPIVVGDTTYVTTYNINVNPVTHQVNYQSYVTVIGPDGVTVPDAVTGAIPGVSVSPGGIFQVGDTVYLVTAESDRTHVSVIGPDGVATAVDLGGDVIAGTPTDVPVVIGDHAYLVTGTGTESYVTVLGPAGAVTTPDPAVVIPGTMVGTPLVAGGYVYLVTNVGGSQLFVTVIAPDGTITPPAPGVAAIPRYQSGQPLIVGDTVYLLTRGGADTNYAYYVTVIGPDGYTNPTTALPGVDTGGLTLVGGKVYLVATTWVPDPAEPTGYDITTYITVIEPDGSYEVPTVENGMALKGAAQGFPVLVGATVYLSTTAGIWAIGTTVQPLPPVEA